MIEDYIKITFKVVEEYMKSEGFITYSPRPDLPSGGVAYEYAKDNIRFIVVIDPIKETSIIFSSGFTQPRFSEFIGHLSKILGRDK